MRIEEVQAALSRNQAALRGLGVKSLSVFGSVARGEARPGSDVDILVEFDKPIGLFGFAQLQRYLETLLNGAKVDLVVREAVLDELKEDIYREAVNVL